MKRRLRNYLITAYVFLRKKALINKGLFSLEEKGKSSKKSMEAEARQIQFAQKAQISKSEGN